MATGICGSVDAGRRKQHRRRSDSEPHNSLCYALSQAACPIALLVGDLTAAEHYIKMLLDQSTRAALALWQAWGRSYQGVLGIKRGDFATGIPLLRAGLSELAKARFAALRQVTFLMAEASARAGQITDGLAMIDGAIGRSEHTEGWLIAGLFRAKGELLLLQNAPGAASTARITSGKRLTWRVGRVPFPGNCTLPRASRDC